MPEVPVPASSLRVRFGEFELDEPNARLLSHGSAIALAPTPFGLLCALVRQPDSLLTKHALLDQVWGHRFVSDSVLKGAISDVRNALGDDPRQPRYIETVPRRGYRFIATPVPLGEAAEPVSQAPAAPRAIPFSPRAVEIEAERAPLFVGRVAEQVWLHRIWERALRGSRAIAWVAGEPGIGKTTLIEYFADQLDGVACARGQCVQHHGQGEPYLPVLEALAELCRRDLQAADLLRAVAPTWLLQLPWLSNAEQREALLRELVGAHAQRMLREMGEFMERYTERQPLLLITEDLHWGDPSTIQLIDYMARRRGNCRLMWLATFRLTEVIALDHPLNAVRHTLRPQGLCDEIVLDSFSETDVAAFVAGRAPAMATDEGFVRALHERTEGVPLFVASIASEVIEQAGRRGAADSARLASTTVPESLSALIDHYVTGLAGERRTLLAAAAVCGMEFRIDTLARVLGGDAGQVAEVCDELVRERLWLMAARPSEQLDGVGRSYAFRHALFRERLHEGTPLSARAELHRQTGATLEAQRAMGVDVTAAELATHFDLGRSPMIALRYYAEAAQAALLHLSPAEAMNLTRRALVLADQMPAEAERHAFEITLATLRGVAAFHTLGAGEEAKSAYLRASALLDAVPGHPMAGLALHGLGFLLDLRAEYPAALVVAERAEALATRSDDPLLTLAACTVKGQVLMMQGHHRAAREALERALPAFERASAANERSFIGFIADPQVTVLAMLSLPLAQLGLFNLARERLQQAYTRARHLAQPMALMVTIWFDALCGIRSGDATRVGVLAGEMQSLVDEFSLAQGKAACRWFQGWADAHFGKPQEGFCQIREAYEDNRALGMISGGSETLGYAAEALLLQGDWEGAQEQLEQAFEIVNTYGEGIFLPQLLLVQAEIEGSRGDLAAAEAAIRRAVIEAGAQDASWQELLALTELCERAIPTADDRRALAELVDQFGETGDTSQLERARRLLENGQQA
ncbi:MAG: transcriptional regulator [Betaproteobacteria bacterium HGW-Betaproteobacteria-7]|jgi:DNA-binding winged helix-turn-helix (wHTH) protein/tetratricopeptide (TPR) repeat protein|nr:MAG: transcriptional regulator [Betaproteobacteria bacterium HGW-Betaproteobacteria-7]